MSEQNRLGRIGVWSIAWSTALGGDGSAYTAEFDEAAAELEELGYGTLWLGGSPAASFAAPVLRATTRLTVATGIVSIWDYTAEEAAAQRAVLERDHPGRFLLGLGVSHSLMTERYRRPYSAMRDYLTALDAAPVPVPSDARVLAALGPKMLELSRDRAAGAHPYLVTPEHTAHAREVLGGEALLAPELKVIVSSDRDAAYDLARGYLANYLRMANYTRSFERLGFTDEDFRDGGSDRLIDAVFAIGDPDAIAARATEFLTAGADHLAVQTVTADPRSDLPRAQWRQLAEALPMK
ncbi:LLM class F420-dependent oxidoreductase [Streptomyces sp. NPDC050560]|uniref:LLM class F420-dependent oxidoreductase n=1 Tax=Streptomyces sp. NPDC050560 TaxID=3365630 RepID=UPI00379DC5AD